MKKKENKRISTNNKGIKLFLFFFMFTITGLLIDKPVFADDKGETKNEDFHIRVIINNPNPAPSMSGGGNSGKKGEEGYVCKDSKAFNFSNSGKHNQALCIYLKFENDFIVDNGEGEFIFEEDKNIDLSSDSSEYVIKKQPGKKNIYLDDKKIISKYEDNVVRIWVDAYEDEIFIEDEIKLNIFLSTISKNEIDLKKNIVDAYLIIKNDEGKILKKQDLFDVEKEIDVLNLKDIKKIYFGNFQKVTEKFFVNNKVGKYFAEISLVLSPEFLNLGEKFDDGYLIEIKSNEIEINILKKDKEKTFWEDNLMWIMFGFGFTGIAGIWWWFILFFKRRLYGLVTEFVLNNKEFILSFEKRDGKIIDGLSNYVKPKMFKLVSKNKILKVLKKVLENEIK